MISLDQVFLLEQKVESAVAKIQQLQAENDALRNKCAELTNALSAKSEQLTSFESDQTQIENGIKKALDRLSNIENSVLKTAVSTPNFGQVASNPVQPKPVVEQKQIVESTPIVETTAPVFEETPVTEPVTQYVPESTFEPEEEISPSFDTMEPTEPEEDSQDGLGFDIF